MSEQREMQVGDKVWVVVHPDWEYPKRVDQLEIKEIEHGKYWDGTPNVRYIFGEAYRGSDRMISERADSVFWTAEEAAREAWRRLVDLFEREHDKIKEDTGCDFWAIP